MEKVKTAKKQINTL